MATRSAVRWTNVALLGLIAVHLLLAILIRVMPDTARGWLGSLPFAARALGHREDLLAQRVRLRDVEGHYQRLGTTGQVFVIQGEAVNRSASALEGIRVEATIYGPHGSVGSKVVSGGNETPLTDLSEAEIVLLQRLTPRLALAPGGSTPFQIVFLAPPDDVREFSSRVLSARRVRQTAKRPASHPASAG